MPNVIEIESTTKPKFRLTDDGENDLCIELTGTIYEQTEAIRKQKKIKIYFSKSVMKK